jgi:hypothetical protein
MSTGELRKYYGVPAKRGMEARERDRGRNPHHGVITGTYHQYVCFRRYGEVKSRQYHPFELDYLVCDEWILGADLQAKHDAKWDAFNARLTTDAGCAALDAGPGEES